MDTIREKILSLYKTHKIAHLGSSMSCVEILKTVKQLMTGEDKLILSKGHAIGAIYAMSGELPEDLPHHATRGHFCDVSTGSLGMGLSIGIGMALADKKRTVYVVCGDGETQEGQYWEAFIYIVSHGIKNIRCIIDANGFQATKECLSSYIVFNKSVKDGHNVDELKLAITGYQFVLAHTIKGKGLPNGIEGSLKSHYWRPE